MPVVSLKIGDFPLSTLKNHLIFLTPLLSGYPRTTSLQPRVRVVAWWGLSRCKLICLESLL